jgi:hypothetical protein
LRRRVKVAGTEYIPEEFYQSDTNAYDHRFSILGHLNVSLALTDSKLYELDKAKKLLILSSVRDPIDRIISLFNYIRAEPMHPNYSKMKNKGYDDFLQFCRQQTANFQFNYLRKSIEDTVENIINESLVFSLEDSIKGFSKTLSILSGIDEKIYERTNVTADKVSDGFISYSREDIPQALLQELQEKNSIDTELYQKAKLSFDRNISRVVDWTKDNVGFIDKVRSENIISINDFLKRFDINVNSEDVISAYHVEDFRDMALEFERRGDISSAEKLMTYAAIARPDLQHLQNKVQGFRLSLS